MASAATPSTTDQAMRLPLVELVTGSCTLGSTVGTVVAGVVLVETLAEVLADALVEALADADALADALAEADGLVQCRRWPPQWA